MTAMETASNPTIARLRATCAALGTGATAEGNRILSGRAETALREALAERAAIVADLDRGDAWFARHGAEQGTAAYARNEDRWIGWLRAYERLCDAIWMAEEALA